MRSLVLLCAIVTVAIGINCYSGTIYNSNSHPSYSGSCYPYNSRYCVKYVGKVGSQTVKVYGCDAGACGSNNIGNGQCKKINYNGASENYCCCSGDYCNSSGAMQLLTLLIVMLTGYSM